MKTSFQEKIALQTATGNSHGTSVMLAKFWRSAAKKLTYGERSVA